MAPFIYAMTKLTKPQRKALKRLYDRDNDSHPTYRAFRRTVKPAFFSDPCVMVRWCGMWLGIEPDGYTHS